MCDNTSMADQEDGDDPYIDALAQALGELTNIMEEREALDERREVIDRRIAKLRRAATGLGSLCGKTAASLSREFPELFPESIDPDTGLTDAIREILKTNAEIYCSPVFIRDELKNKGYDLNNYKNALASIHTVLKRLRTQNEVIDTTREGRTVYRWKAVVPLPPQLDVINKMIEQSRVRTQNAIKKKGLKKKV